MLLLNHNLNIVNLFGCLIRSINVRLNRFHEKAFRIFHQVLNLLFEQFPDKEQYFSIH